MTGPSLTHAQLDAMIPGPNGADDEPPWPGEPIPLRAVAPTTSRRREVPPLLGWRDLMVEPDEPPPMIVSGVPKVGCTVLAGAPKVGKSLWATQQALTLGCRTLYVVEEGSRRGISYRLRRQALALGIVDPPLSVAHLHRTRLDNPASVKALRDFVHLTGAELVILDPLNKAHGADENRPTQMTPVMDALSAIAYDFGIAVLALHHLAKPSAERRGDLWDRFRGASSIRSGTDANLILDGSGASVHLVGEFRDAEPLSEYLLLDREGLIFRPVDVPQFVGKIPTVALRTFLSEHEEVTALQVAAEFTVTKHTARAALETMPGVDWADGLRGARFYTLGTGQ